MPRRYLTESEIELAIGRGKQVDAFLGGGSLGDQRTIRYVSVRGELQQITAELWEVDDPADPGFLDVYSLYPPKGGDAPDQIFVFPSVSEALLELERHFPKVSSRFVNQGAICDEYADYLGE